jgi:drug/metabolite transporter (DMT)-like permease
VIDRAAGSTAIPSVLWGTVAALFTVTIWGGWIVATRFGVTSNLAPLEIAILRIAPPGLILLPVFFRIPWRTLRWRYIAALIGGAGAPFLLVVSTGMQFAPTADIGALLPGTMPLFVALFAFMLLGERFDRWRMVGFVLIIAGGLEVGGVSLFAGDPGEWRGHILFLCGASMWAIYTIGLRQSGLDAWQAAAVVNTGSMLLLVPLALLFGDLQFDAPLRDIAIQIGAQGIMSGLLAMAAYGIAIRHLGASSAAAFSALTPVIATLIAVPVMAELPAPLTWLGVIAVCCGVALASGVLHRRAERPT